jgi:hypothetical protein
MASQLIVIFALVVCIACVLDGIRINRQMRKKIKSILDATGEQGGEIR